MIKLMYAGQVGELTIKGSTVINRLTLPDGQTGTWEIETASPGDATKLRAESVANLVKNGWEIV